MGLQDRVNGLASLVKFFIAIDRKFCRRLTFGAVSAAVLLALPAPAFALLGTTTTVVPSQNPSASGTLVTFSATVTGLVVPPTGTVTFKDGATTIGSGSLNGSGIATFSTAALSSGSHSITAVYGGNTLYNSSTSTVLTQSVVANATSTSLMSSTNPSALEQSVIFTAAVTSAGGTPTGTVTFKDGAITLGTGTLDGSGQTTFATSVLTPGNHSITAVYSGDSNFSAGSSPVLTQTVNLGTSSTAVISSANPSSLGQSVTFTATVSGLVIMPAGTVTFKDGAATLGTGNINASGQATFTTGALTSGSHSITAVYGGDTLYNSSTSNLLTQAVNQSSTTISVGSSANPSAQGASVTFTATVAGTGGTPTGTVTFKDGATTLGTGTLDGSGHATYATSALSLGAHTITAVYGGDSSFTGSTSTPLTQAVNASSSATALVSSVNPSAFGQSVTFTATVSGSGSTPTGTVTFKDGATTLGSGTLDGGGQAAFSTGALAAGGHSITAVYSGDSTFAASTSSPLTQSVGQNTSSTSLTPSANPSAYGAPVTFTATVSGSGTTPTGTVTFKDGATTLGTGTLNGAGQAALSTSALGAGSHSITAVYGGDGNFAPSTSAPLTQSIGQNSASVALASSANPSTPGQAVTFTATISTTGGVPTGSVTFKDAGATLGTIALSGNSAALTVSSLAAGAHSITAIYGGDANFGAATSPALSQSVDVPPDSPRLRALQVAVTPIAAQISGQAISGAIDSAIAEGFAENCPPLTASAQGIRMTSCTKQDATDRVTGAFAALKEFNRPQWLLWTDARGTEWNTNASSSDVRGRQINTLSGLTYRMAPDFLLGLLGGYEAFNYNSNSLDGHLHGDGWTFGSYLGWRFLPGVRFDLGIAYSLVNYQATAGTASASIPGHRTLVTAGLAGTYRMTQAWEFEPSARVYALWENESSYVDSLGTAQRDRNFETGRASAGAKLSYRLQTSDLTTIAPYVGLYADYYFTKDNADTIPEATPAIGGAAARVVSGISLTARNAAQFTLGGEVGGLGGGKFTTWTIRTRASIPF